MTVQEALNLGAQFHSAGRLAEAESVYRQILSQCPGQPDALHLLGVIAIQGGNLQHAEALLRHAIGLSPAVPSYHSNLCVVLTRLDRYDEAIESGYAALRLNMDFADAWVNLGQALQKKGTMEEAIAAYRRALDLRPEHDKAAHNLDAALDEIGSRTDAEIASLQQSAARYPRDATIHNRLGALFMENGQIDESVNAYRRAVALDPANPCIASNLLFSLHFHPDISAPAILEAARQWNQQHGKPLSRSLRPHSNDRSPDRRLRIGYVGPDFNLHCQALFLLPLLTHHDRKAVEVFCYSATATPDEITTRLREKTDVWRDISTTKDDRAAGMIRQDGIDILVDLTLHMVNNRLTLFARKPAPIQATWLGYPGTTGLETIDYRLTDSWLDPDQGGEGDEVYSERSIRLAETFWCFDPAALRLPNDCTVAPPPMQKNGYVTFGCLNNWCKINDPLLELWGNVLNAVPRSHLLLLAPRSSFRRHVLEKLAASDISFDRIEFVDRNTRWKYMPHFNRIDIGLDTVPYNGHTTSLEMLWMGVPLITLVGPTVVSRAGLSQLSNLDLRELVAHNPQEYVELAATLAADTARLTELRSTLRQRITRSPLMDAPRFARNMESAYRQMWRQWTGK